jgi:hypothetical protein
MGPHLSEKLAEFVFEELPVSEMADAKLHLKQCGDCREQVEQFQITHAMLKASPDVEPPRNIVFDFEKPRVSRVWRWLPAAVAVAALFVMTIALAGRVHVQFRDSQLTVAFGQAISPAAETDQASMLTEIQRLQGTVAYLEARQQSLQRETIATESALQMIAVRSQRSPVGD